MRTRITIDNTTDNSSTTGNMTTSNMTTSRTTNYKTGNTTSNNKTRDEVREFARFVLGVSTALYLYGANNHVLIRRKYACQQKSAGCMMGQKVRQSSTLSWVERAQTSVRACLVESAFRDERESSASDRVDQAHQAVRLQPPPTTIYGRRQ